MDVLVAVVDLNQAAWGQRATAAAAVAAAASATATAASATAVATTAANAARPAEPVLTISAFVDQLIVFFNAFLVSPQAL
jgi:hypothetical protein